MLTNLIVTGVGLGLASHFLSQLHEPPLVLTLRLHALGFIVLAGLLWKQQGLPLWKALLESVALSLSYVISLTTSLIIYRLHLHRIHKFPGDAIHKLTMFSWLPIDWEGKRPAHTQALHAKYGPIVRIGPRELSIADYRALPTPANATQSTICRRGPWYSEQQPIQEQWKRSDLQYYQRAVAKGTDQLIEIMKRVQDGDKSDDQLDLSEYFTWFSLDIIGLLSFEKSFGLLEEASTPAMISVIDERLRMLNTVASVPYCMEAVRLLPSTIKEFENWVAEATKCDIVTGEERKEGQPAILELLLGVRSPRKEPQFNADSSLLVFLASETLRSTLTWCIFELVQQPSLMTRVYEEVGRDTIDGLQQLESSYPFLDACIYETLRLWPPIPSGLQQMTSSRGLTVVEGTHLPPNIFFSVPTFTIQRDPVNFTSPNDFDPFRWLSDQRTVDLHRLEAFCPFGYPSSECQALPLAAMVCRFVVARLLQTFQISMAKGFSADTFRASYRDQHSVANLPLLVCIHPR